MAHVLGMKVRLVAVAVLAAGASSARAEPFPVQVMKPDTLRVDVSCADYWATPERGLRVLVDGVALPAQEENGTTVSGYTEDGSYSQWVPTDIGFAVEPGVHHVSIEAPGCAPAAGELTIAPLVPSFLSGRLPISDDALRGTVAAPNGLGFGVGLFEGTFSLSTGSDDLFHTAYTYDRGSTTGAVTTFSYEHRGFAFAYDFAMAGGSVTGSAISTEPMGSSPGPAPFDGWTMQFANTLRVGARHSLEHVALAAGTGVGGDLWIVSAHVHQDPTTTAFLANPGLADLDWYVPVWASLTVKPSCGWGVQVLASYQLHPTAMAESSPIVTAGVLFQGSDACSQPPSMVVR